MTWTQVTEEVTPAERLEASEKPNADDMVRTRRPVTTAMLEDLVKDLQAKPKKAKPKADMVNHPPHYTSHPSGVECIQITEHMGFNLGNALKYIWRADLKGSAVEDLEKAIFYINRELVKRRTK